MRRQGFHESKRLIANDGDVKRSRGKREQVLVHVKRMAIA